MEISEMNVSQEKALVNIEYAVDYLLDCLGNTMIDHQPGSPEYESAKALLKDHESLVKELYKNVTTAIYSECCCFNPVTVQKELQEINSCDKEWLMEQCEHMICREGY